MLFKKKKKLVTHNGSFHTDDVFACAVLCLLLDKRGQSFEIIRTRDEKVIEKGDFIFDVGGVYEVEKNRFDHHQRGGAGNRVNGIPYSAFGLVWKHFGKELCDQEEKVFEFIDKKVVCPLDAIDNGVDLVTSKFGDIFPYDVPYLFLINAPTWKEDSRDIDKIFIQQVERAREILSREIKIAKDNLEGERIIIECYKNSVDKRIVELPSSFPRSLYQRVLSSLSEPIYLIYKSEYSENFKVEAVAKSSQTFESRKPFPESWRGFTNTGSSASEVIGIPGIQFTHNSGFMIVADSREHAFAVANKSLETIT